ncbi:MAG: sigma-54 interaction domain-containing protein [bacterium]
MFDQPFCQQHVLPMLSAIAASIHTNQSFEAVSDSVAKTIRLHLQGTTRIALSIYNQETGALFIEKSWGLSEEQKLRGVYRSGEGITGRVLQEGTPIIIPRVSEEPAFLNRTGGGTVEPEEDFAFMCVPVLWQHEVLGTLSVDRPVSTRKRLEDDLSLLSIITAMIAQAVQIYKSHLEENALLKEENRRLRDALYQSVKPSSIVGNSRSMRQCLALLEKVYNKSTPVLVLGESGTGKELIAQALHFNSERKDKPFVSFNCAALPENLAESELFGHEKGSFTGASASRKGKFEEADGGSIFLDEVGELSPGIQAKLLRVLQNGEVEKIGSNRPIKVRVRVICATHRDLPAMIANGEFREDLYYRINVFPITIPPLRERGSDILLLANHFVERYSEVHGNPVKRISSPAIDLLMSYHWPGNVRELENTIERAVILSEDGVIHSYHLPPSLQSAQSSNTKMHGTLQSRMDELEREMIVEALKYARGKMAKAARELGLTERVMALRLKKYNIDYQLYRGGEGRRADA